MFEEVLRLAAAGDSLFCLAFFCSLTDRQLCSASMKTPPADSHQILATIRQRFVLNTCSYGDMGLLATPVFLEDRETGGAFEPPT